MINLVAIFNWKNNINHDVNLHNMSNVKKQNQNNTPKYPDETPDDMEQQALLAKLMQSSMNKNKSQEPEFI